jgi:hypothetical protein
MCTCPQAIELRTVGAWLSIPAPVLLSDLRFRGASMIFCSIPTRPRTIWTTMRYLLVTLTFACLLYLGAASREQSPERSTTQSRCPAITVTCPRYAFIGDRLPISVDVNGSELHRTVSYKWSVPEWVKLVSRADSRKITVDPQSMGLQSIAQVEIGGLPKGCPNKAECNTLVSEEFGPTITVDCPTEPVRVGEPVHFSANASGGRLVSKLTLNWRLSEGKIESGQGTYVIMVGTKDVSAGKITATVKLGGFNPVFQSEGSCTVNLKTDR